MVRKFNIRNLRDSLKENRICDSQYPRGKCLAPAVKIPYRRPWGEVPSFAPVLNQFWRLATSNCKKVYFGVLLLSPHRLTDTTFSTRPWTMVGTHLSDTCCGSLKDPYHLIVMGVRGPNAAVLTQDVPRPNFGEATTPTAMGGGTGGGGGRGPVPRKLLSVLHYSYESCTEIIDFKWSSPPPPQSSRRGPTHVHYPPSSSDVTDVPIPMNKHAFRP